MALEVHPAAIRKFGNGLGTDAADVPTAASYTRQWLDFTGSSEGIFVGTSHMNNQVREALLRLWPALEHLLYACDHELNAVSHYYQTTDHHVAGTFDAKVKAVDVASGDDYQHNHHDPDDTVPQEPDDWKPPDHDPDDGDDPGLDGIVPAI